LNFDLCVLFFPNPPVRAVAHRDKQSKNKTRFNYFSSMERARGESIINQRVSLVKRCVFIHLEKTSGAEPAAGPFSPPRASRLRAHTFIRKITF
jgi:hypothetical protein